MVSNFAGNRKVNFHVLRSHRLREWSTIPVTDRRVFDLKHPADFQFPSAFYRDGTGLLFRGVKQLWCETN
jgi:hypothetical protein